MIKKQEFKNTVEKVKFYLNEIEKDNKKGKKINAILHLNPNIIEEAKLIDEKIKKRTAGKLAGKVIAVKSNIHVKNMIANCASKTLSDYICGYDATVIEKIKQEDGLIIGMCNMDEFACGSSGETSSFGPVKNPTNLKLIPGGSSSGSAAAVAANFCDMTLGSDTGGSIRNPASCCGVVGMKPSYSSVSRYGLIDLSMSLDQIGPLAKNISDAALMFKIISGKDKKDPISQESKKINLSEIEKIPKKIEIGLLDFKIKDKRINELIKNFVSLMSKKYGWKIKKVSLKNIDLAIATYYLLVYAEFFSATRKFDGRKYGKRIEESAGPEVLRRILGGAEISKAEYSGRYYNKALKVKKLIEKEFEEIFKKVDCVICPTIPKLPHKLGEKISVRDMYDYDALTIPSNLAGNCALSMPIGKIENCHIGMQIICDKFKEQKLFQIARSFEKEINKL
jgi:aspartyl-tRNA(Asn)/glutamyl-tRNA(Gln) amidotransferase subunit A